MLRKNVELKSIIYDFDSLPLLEKIAKQICLELISRGHLQTFIHTVHLLQGLTDLQSLPVADILKNLLETEGGAGQPSAVLGSKHLISWGFEDQLSLPVSGAEHTVKEAKEAADKDKDKGECLHAGLNLLHSRWSITPA
jgi:E3 ubiquitin-protein ligase HECTD4